MRQSMNFIIVSKKEQVWNPAIFLWTGHSVYFVQTQEGLRDHWLSTDCHSVSVCPLKYRVSSKIGMRLSTSLYISISPMLSLVGRFWLIIALCHHFQFCHRHMFVCVFLRIWKWFEKVWDERIIKQKLNSKFSSPLLVSNRVKASKWST